MNPIKQYLVQEKVPQIVFAEQVSISPSMLSLILSGKRQPGIFLARRIETVTGIPRHVLRPDIYEAAE